MPGAPPIPGIPSGMAAGIASGFGICGGAHAGAVCAGGGGAADGIPCAPCKSRSAEPEITRVNSPGPDANGGGAFGGNDGGVAHGEADAGDAGANGGAAADGANGDGAAGVSGSGAAADEAADAPGCASDCSSCVKPPATAGAAGAGGACGDKEDAGLALTGPNELVPSPACSFCIGSWFSACSNCVNPPAAAGTAGAGVACADDMERCSPLSTVGSCLSDFSGSSCGDMLAPWLENIFVNALGSDCVAGVGVTVDGTGALDTGLENIFVNSPGADFGAAGEGSAATGAVDDGALVDGACGEDASGFENIRVNSPGADCAGCPGLDSERLEGGACAGETGLLSGAEFSVAGRSRGFSIATGLKTRATSFVRPSLGTPGAFGTAFDPAAPPLVSGVVSACSMRVNSPALRDASGPPAGAASFTASCAGGNVGCVGDATTAGSGGSAASTFFSGAACLSSEASKSSSARGAARTCPKTPVALDG